ncbi:MAG: FAD-dependent oxidoreductase [Candidatus Competibacterales bacterium]
MNLPRLPVHLGERQRPINPKSINPNGEFVLYWMHHAARGHENPALHAAIAAANDLDLPVLVYQGLGGNHRFNSDRHHTFILEGARDVQAELARRQIAYAFYLGEEPKAPTPLRSLACRAALVVAEDFPAPPFPRWTAQLAKAVDVAVWAVDAHCVVPMQWLGRPVDRAFKFRDKAYGEFEQRILEPWRDAKPLISPFAGELGFEPVDLASADIAALCARCAIDHTVPAVPHTPGGSRAGYRRWETFKRQGLGGYAKLRNNAAIEPPKGVSRLSPYLHHGHVSALRIAREAMALNGAGAEKFIDELFVWRELSHNLCFHRRELERLSVLPRWAQDTLTHHAKDPRDAVYDWETLARGRTGHRLWDAAQKSLLIHGELHNNLRMTWGKALLPWTKTPEQALDYLIDLNHRFALDGNDPNSYGGLLWCLGMLDRPYTPEAPVLGTVRPRPLEQHQSRLDLATYEGRVTRPARDYPGQVAVVGAGLAGLFAARALADQGIAVTVFDKGRSVGGRTATRRSEGVAFDHGAQYFTLRDPRMARYREAWLQAGVIAPWQGRWAKVTDGQVTPTPDQQQRYVGVPGMSALAKHLARDLEVVTQAKIHHLEASGKGWRLAAEAGGLETPHLATVFDAVVLAMPPSQAQALLAPVAHDLATATARAPMAPCWTVMARFAEPLPLDFDGGFCRHEVLSWAARNSSKPGRPPAEAWVVHAGPKWSKNHEEDQPEAVQAALLEAFFAVTGCHPQVPLEAQAHRWRYAMAEPPLGAGCLWDAERRLGACGDWCHGNRLEGALLSGMAMAGRLLERSPPVKAQRGAAA